MRKILLASCVLALAGAAACGGGAGSDGAITYVGDGNGATAADGSGNDGKGSPSSPKPRANGNGGGTSGAESDAGLEPLPPPMPADPCSDDLAFVGGEVRPDLGELGSLDAATVDTEKSGKFAVYQKDVKIPVKAGELMAAGYDIKLDQDLELSGTIYAPSEDDGKSLATGSFPLVVVMPGFQASYTMYAELSQHFASHGFAVLGVDTQGSNTEAQHDKEALQASQAITWALEQSELKDVLDADKIATAGHSKGGKVSFFTAAIDPRVDLAFGWDPSNAGGPPCFINAETCQAQPVAPNCGAEEKMVPLPEGVMQYTHAESFVFGVPPDSVNPGDEHNALNFYRGAPSPADLVYFKGGHVAFLPQPLFRDDDIIRITKAVQTAKLLTTFYGAKGLEKYLPGGDYLKNQGDKVTMVASK